MSLTASKFDSSNNFDEVINGSSDTAASHKFLQVELLADENVAAKHGNNTADFLLVIANIVRIRFFFCYMFSYKLTYTPVCILENRRENVSSLGAIYLPFVSLRKTVVFQIVKSA